jgi:hypothetical protein
MRMQKKLANCMVNCKSLSGDIRRPAMFLIERCCSNAHRTACTVLLLLSGQAMHVCC